MPTRDGTRHGRRRRAPARVGRALEPHPRQQDVPDPEPPAARQGRSASSASTTRSPSSCAPAASRSTTALAVRRGARGARGHARRGKRRPPAHAPPMPPRGRGRRRACSARPARSSARRAAERWPQIDALFDELLAQKGSDLHLGVGYPPLMRAARRARRACATQPLDAAEMEALLFEIVDARAEDDDHATSSISTSPTRYGDKARFRANYFYKTTGLGGGVPHDPDEGPDARRARLPRRRPQARRAPRRASSSSPGRPARASRPRSRR